MYTDPSNVLPMTYADRLQAELNIYQQCQTVHELPEIFHYWSNRYLRPVLESFGFSSPDDLFRTALLKICQQNPTSSAPLQFLSVGSGNCDLEVSLAAHLQARGYSNFRIVCMDINPQMLARGQADATQQGLQNFLHFLEADFNSWSAIESNTQQTYSAVIANQSLHHVVALEHLLDQIKLCLEPNGNLLISDMIGRNGHLRWPAALDMVQSFWRQLPPSYRYNPIALCYEELFIDRDHSTQSFEGIRAQDILRLLHERFHFHLFLPFANAVDIFLDRCFGPHFDATRAWDREFIDRLHQADTAAMQQGLFPPTHLVATLSPQPAADCMISGNLSPAFCLQAIDQQLSLLQSQLNPPDESPYALQTLPHSLNTEFERALRPLAQQDQIRRLTLDKLEDQLLQARSEIQRRTHWALGLEKELEQSQSRLQDLQSQLAESSAWALALDSENQRLTTLAHSLRAEWEERTQWALNLKGSLDQATQHAASLQVQNEILGERLQTAQTELAQLAWARRLSAYFRH